MVKYHIGHRNPLPIELDGSFKIAFLLNVLYTIVEFSFGIALDSMALVADALHNLTDVLGLVVGWAAFKIAKKESCKKYTYGLGKITIWAAILNGLLIISGAAAICYESIKRIDDPTIPNTTLMIVVASGGIVINMLSAMMFRKSQKHDLNAKGVFLHLAADAVISLGVVIAGIVIMLTQYTIIDPIAAVVISVIISYYAISLIKSAFELSLDAVPSNINVKEVEQWLRSLDGVTDVHDIHIWPLSTSTVALTAHIVIPAGHPGEKFLDFIGEELEKRFGIGHATIQIES